MIALKTLGILCIILLCFGPAISLIADVFQKNKSTRLDKNGKRESKINHVSYWEYLIVILPVSLLLIGLFTNDREEKLVSLTILGIGYSFLLLSSYNNRIIIPWVNKTVLITCLILAIISYLLSLTNYNYQFQSGLNSLALLFFPLSTYVYLLIARQIIKLITNTFPLTLDKYFRVGHFSNRYNRKATYWDLIWTLWNITGLPATIIYILVMTK
jgi:hypothetical protein